MTASFRYLTDANMPRSVVLALQTIGRDVLESRQAMPADAKDQAIAQLAVEYGFVLISYDRDFVNIRRRMVQEMTCGESHLILLRIPEMEASGRIVLVAEEIEQILTEAISWGRIVDRIEVKRDRVTAVFNL